ncbi:DoxX family protein [Nocardia concava]|uniref:DoxX family protein n=1 Tax=Nocardia concava TaxID=257281 RepID=UPI00031FD557|nr:DoxX family protein [Nocardia concava]
MFRRVGYPLLATAFIVDGVETLTNPETRVKSATTLVQQGQRVLPDRVAGNLPSDPAQVVRATAAIRVGGGVLLALGKAPRLASLVLAATTVPVALIEHDFWNEPDRERRTAVRTAFLRDAGLLGGLLIAASDTRGKPSLGWRARRAAHRTRDHGKSSAAELAENVAAHAPEVWEALRDKGGQLAEVARDKGGQVAEVTREKGGQLAETARDKGGQFAETALDKGGHLAEVARDRGEQLAEVARDRGEQLAEVARDKGGHLAEAARHRGEHAADVARERRKVARRRAREYAARVQPD